MFSDIFVYLQVIYNIMIDLKKGLSLFMTYDSQLNYTFYSLLSFLSNDYTILSIGFGDDKFGIPSLCTNIKVNESNYLELVNKNLFRVEIIAVHIPHNLKDYPKLLEFLTKLNLIVFIISTLDNSIKILLDGESYIRNFYEIKKEKEVNNGSIGLGTLPNFEDLLIDRNIFVNITNDDEFTISQYKTSYIRDKKIDIFLDNLDN